MSKNFNLRSVYLYLVCFVTLVIFIFGTIFTVQRVVDIAVDGGYYYTTLEDFQTRFITYKPDGTRVEPQLSQEEIEARYEKYLEQEKQRARTNNTRQLASSFSAMLVGGAFWFYHWKKLSNDEKSI